MPGVDAYRSPGVDRRVYLDLDQPLDVRRNPPQEWMVLSPARGHTPDEAKALGIAALQELLDELAEDFGPPGFPGNHGGRPVEGRAERRTTRTTCPDHHAALANSR